MAGRDLRVSVDPIFRAFGVAVTVTPPGGAAIETEGVWVGAVADALPFGFDTQRSEPRHLLVLRRDEVASVPRGTVIVAPAMRGGANETWRVDGEDLTEPDLRRVRLVPDD